MAPAAVPFGIAIGVAVGLLGARESACVAQQALGRGFAALAVVAAGYLLISAPFLGGPPASS